MSGGNQVVGADSELRQERARECGHGRNTPAFDPDGSPKVRLTFYTELGT
jgi:hypothetical protein